MSTHAAKKRAAASGKFRPLVDEAVTPDDVLAICRMLAAAAKQGNITAAKLLFNYLGGPPAALPASPSENGGVSYYIPDPRALHTELVASPPAEPADHASA
jgi:hypothetical protein